MNELTISIYMRMLADYDAHVYMSPEQQEVSAKLTILWTDMTSDERSEVIRLAEIMRRERQAESNN